MGSVPRRVSRPRVPLAMLILVASGVVGAENIDPANRFAWSENLGWINAQPSGPGGPGVQVSDGGLAGYLWSENAGWISVSGSGYGVANNGCGMLAGYAWSENTGWINFAPATCGGDPTCGVKIDPANGNFSGRAWSENAGWITFAAAGPVAYHVATTWSRAAPASTTVLTAAKSGTDLVLSWGAVSGAARSSPMAAIRPAAIATSVRRGGSPDPSWTSAWRRTRSITPSAPSASIWAGAAARGGLGD